MKFILPFLLLIGCSVTLLPSQILTANQPCEVESTIDFQLWIPVGYLPTGGQIVIGSQDPGQFFRATLTNTPVVLTWSPDADPQTAGYDLYAGPTPTNLTSVLQVGDVTNATVIFSKPGAVTWFAANAFDDAGDESAMCAPVSYTARPLILTIHK
jgi:hypothetical protein